jgi:hypothetical protein
VVFDSQQGQEMFWFCKTFKLVAGLNWPSLQWVPRVISPGVKQLGFDADHRSPFVAKVMPPWY